MSANQNPRVKVDTSHDGMRVEVFVDGQSLLALRGYVPGSGTHALEKEEIAFIGEAVSALAAARMPSPKPTFAIDATIYITVEGERVTHVNILPSQETVTAGHLTNGDEGITDEEAIAAAKVIDSTCWDPVLAIDTATGLSWEG